MLSTTNAAVPYVYPETPELATDLHFRGLLDGLVRATKVTQDGWKRDDLVEDCVQALRDRDIKLKKRALKLGINKVRATCRKLRALAGLC